MDTDAFEDLKLFFQQSGKDGISLYDHLASLIQCLQDVPASDRTAMLEDISRELKLSTFVQSQSKETELDEKV